MSKARNAEMKKRTNAGRPEDGEDDELMNRVDVAHWLGVSVGAIDRYCREEGLPFMKVGRRVLFRRSEVEMWLRGRGENGAGGRGGARK